MFLNHFSNFYRQWKGGHSLKDRLRMAYSGLVMEIKIMRVKLYNLEKANFELGIYHFKKGALSDAIFRFRLLEIFKSQKKAIYYYLCHCYMNMRKYNKAERYLGLYEQSNDMQFKEECTYYRDILNKRDIDVIPEQIIKDKFDQLAVNYDALYKKKQDSHQMQLYKAILSALSEMKLMVVNQVLDLGCGTGQIGHLLRLNKLANTIVGVDLSSEMINAANNKVVEGDRSYSALHNFSAKDFFKANMQTKFDLVIMADFITYNSDVQSLIQWLDDLTHAGSILAINFKLSSANDMQFIHKYGEFYYKSEFIQHCFEKYNWRVQKVEEAVFLNNIHGNLMIYIKN